jgi:hypothetical protein
MPPPRFPPPAREAGSPRSETQKKSGSVEIDSDAVEGSQYVFW